MDEEIRKMLIEDHRRVNDNIERILSGGKNGLVINPGYISPTVSLRQPQPMHLGTGELKHLYLVRSVLECVLALSADGPVKIPREDLIAIGAPKYLSDLCR